MYSLGVGTVFEQAGTGVVDSLQSVHTFVCNVLMSGIICLNREIDV